MNKKILFGLFIGLVAFWAQAVSAAINPGDILINEFYTNPSSGQEWYEILNTTTSPIVLSGITIDRLTSSTPIPALSGTLPAKGIMVFSTSSDPGNDAGDIITLKDGGVIISAVSYGTSTSDEVEKHMEGAPGVGKSGIYTYTSDAEIKNGSYSIGDATKGWFNNAVIWDCYSSISVPPTLESIEACLYSQAIVSNLESMDDPSNATGITFERRSNLLDSATIIGKIQFTGPLNITGTETLNYLKLLV
ncbi:MAG: lamin tail domain-containing protein, partial [Candidatus Pacebacteria bacterium]|nr:lamin tail domain-containing protein [Candidatus Paceibacterota bacterium]